MASQDSSSGRRDPLDAEEDLRSAFAALARAPLPVRPEYASQLRSTLRDEFVAQTTRRAMPRWRRWFASPARPAATPNGRVAPQRGGYGLRLAMTAVGAVLILALAAVLVTGSYPLGSSAQVATIRVSAGEVHVVRPVRVLVDTGLVRPLTVSPGEPVRLRPGDQLLSDPATDAEIALPDGSKMAVGPGVQLSVEELQARSASRPLVIAMRLDRGEIRSQVEHLRADTDRFEVKTPNLVAQARGTVFRVDVRSEGTRVATDSGVVRVNWDGKTVDVEAGRELQVLLGASVPEVHVRPQSPDLIYGVPDTLVEVNDQGEQLLFTNSIMLPWRIRTLPGVKVTLFVDDVPFRTVTSGSDGSADIDLGLAMEGSYRVTAVMEMPTGERSVPSPAYVLVVDRTSPSLLLTSPSEPQVAGKSIRVAGRTEPGVTLELNGKSVTVDQAGDFEQILQLVPGSNSLLLVATDRAGNSIKLQSVIVSETTEG